MCAMLFHGFMVDGLFHADPHPGNIFVAPGEPATVIDFGMVGRIDRRMALGYTRFMMATALNDGESAGRAALEMLGEERYRAKELADAFRRHNIASVDATLPFYQDEARRMSIAKQGREELERQFARDRERFEKEHGGSGWQ